MRSPPGEGTTQGLGNDGTGTRQDTKSKSFPQVVCTEYRPFKRQTLRGFAEIRIDPPGIKICGWTAHEKNGKRWLGAPAKQFTGEDGVLHWQPIVTMEKGAYWQFQDHALRAIDELLDQSGRGVREEVPPW